MADGRWRDVQLGGRPFEAQMTRRGFEGPQFGQGWQLAHRSSVDEFSSSCT